jgi:CRP-like cAMP-binding protein
MSQVVNGNLSPVEKVLCLQRVDIFKYATTEMLGYISSIAREVRLPARSTIFSEQEMSDAMFVVVSGHVRLEKEGREVLVAGPSQSVGTWATLRQRSPDYERHHTGRCASVENFE